jgi:hypothetical protein
VGEPVDDVVLLAEREEVAHRENLERDPEHVQGDQGEDERGRADQEDRERREQVVEAAVLVDRRDDAERDAHQHRDQCRRRHQRQRRAQAVADLGRDRPAGDDGVPEIALDDVSEPADVPDRDGLVEAELLPPPLEIFRRQAGADLGVHPGGDRVARGGRQDEEGRDRDPDQYGHRDEEATKEVGAHVGPREERRLPVTRQAPPLDGSVTRRVTPGSRSPRP